MNNEELKIHALRLAIESGAVPEHLLARAEEIYEFVNSCNTITKEARLEIENKLLKHNLENATALYDKIVQDKELLLATNVKLHDEIHELNEALNSDEVLIGVAKSARPLFCSNIACSARSN